MKTLLSIFTLTMIIATSPLYAQEGPPAPRYSLPTVDTTVTAGVEYKCLSVPQWRTVMLIANEYQGLYDWRLQIQSTLDAYATTSDNYELLIANYRTQIDLLKSDRTYLQLRLGSEMDSAKKLKTISNVERGILWGVIAVETVMLGVFGVRAVAQP